MSNHFVTVRKQCCLLCCPHNKKKVGCIYIYPKYVDALEKTGCESLETTIRRRRLLLAGFLHRQSDERLTRRLLYGGLVNGAKRRRGRPEKSWWTCLLDDLKAFGIDPDTWHSLARSRQGWYERVSQGAEDFLCAWKQGERDAARVRHARQAERTASRAKTNSPSVA